MDNVIDILLKLMPLWQVITILLMGVGMWLYYDKLKPIDKTTNILEKALQEVTANINKQSISVQALEQSTRKHEKALQEVTANINKQSISVQALEQSTRQHEKALQEVTANINKQSISVQALEQSTRQHEKALQEVTANINKLHNSICCVERDTERHEKRIEKLDQNVSDIKDSVGKISAFLGQKYKAFIDMYGIKNSPRRLNPTGEEVFTEINGREFLEANKEQLFAYIDTAMPETPYDVEQEAFGACMRETSRPTFNDFKRYVYNAPLRTIIKDGKEIKHEVTLDEICFILSIPLRDMYLEAHPEII